MRDVTLWKLPVAFLFTFAAVYGLALWRGPLGFYDSGMYSVSPGSTLDLVWVFVFALVINAIWWAVLLLPSGIRRSAPT